jgi:hypothetical protein
MRVYEENRRYTGHRQTAREIDKKRRIFALGYGITRGYNRARISWKRCSSGRFSDKRQEHFVCLALNGANEVIGNRVVTVGLLNSNQVHPREVFLMLLWIVQRLSSWCIITRRVIRSPVRRILR